MANHATVTYQLDGPYSYERETEPEIEYRRYINNRDVDEWIEHCMQVVTPYTRVRLVIELYE